MNNIFQKNLQALMVKDEDLAKKIESYVVNEIPNLVNENAFYNFIYKNIYLHNSSNPLAEAKEIFSMAENTPVSIHLVFGMGLGYLFQVASANSLGSVILYEPDLNILKTALTLVDFSKEILKNNVYIAETAQKAGEYIYQKSNTKNSPLLLSTNAYRELFADSFEDLVEEFKRMVGRFNLDRNYTQEKFYPLLKNIITEIPNLIDETPLIKIKDFYKGKTAVVVSAGPTLDRNIETIKKYRENIVLIVVGTAMKALYTNGIKPDFLCIIEAYDSSKQIEGMDLSEVNFVTEPYSNSTVKQSNFKKIYSHISCNMPINSFWTKITGENNQEYFSKGTVSYTALNTARILGCSKIVLVGQDLAYIEGQCYSKDSAYKDLECRFNADSNKYEIAAKDFESFMNAISNSPDENERKEAALYRLKSLNSSLYYVKSITGSQIPTESVYAAFIAPLSEFTQNYKDIEFVNTSLIGAQIDGFKNISLEEALKDSTRIENRNPICDFKYDKSIIKENLLKEISFLNDVEKRIETGKNLLKRLHNDITRYRMINEDILKSLKKLSQSFVDLSINGNSSLYDFIIASEKINMDYAMKTARQFDFQTVTLLAGKFKTYYSTAENRINEIIDLLKDVVEKL